MALTDNHNETVLDTVLDTDIHSETVPAKSWNNHSESVLDEALAGNHSEIVPAKGIAPNHNETVLDSGINPDIHGETVPTKSWNNHSETVL
jgi:hypothetical protein